ncbi:MAG: FAD-dependent oxidoreductase [Pseudomonadota bacterium]
MKFDLAIIGGGIIGVTVASLTKARNPALNIAVLEQHLIGTGASLYGGAVRVPLGATAAHRDLARRSEELFLDLSAWAGPLPGRHIEIIWIVPVERQGELRSRLVSASRPMTASERRRLCERIPALVLSAGDAVLVGETGWYGHPGQTAVHLVGHLRRQPGVAVYEGLHVVAIEDRADGCEIVTADEQVFSSKHVVRATGPWLDLQGARVPNSDLRTKKISAFHVDLAPTDNDPAIVFVEEDAYLLPDSSNRRWIFCVSSQTWDVEPSRSRLALDAEDWALAEGTLRRHAPALLDHCRGGRVFCDAYSATRLPAIARDPQSVWSVHALGCSGAGYRFAPAIAERTIGLFHETLPGVAMPS